MKHLSVLSLCLALGSWACGSGGGPNGGTGGWEPLGKSFFTGRAANTHSIAAGSGSVAVGYWDIDLGQPAVQQIAGADGNWAYACGGPVPLVGLAVDEHAPASFRFRRDGSRSVIGFNRSLNEPEFVLFACEGGGEWQRLPSVPLGLLPGYTDGFTTFPEQTFTFSVREGRVYAVVNSDESTWPDEKTCLSLFLHDGADWSLASERACYPRVTDGFGYVAHHSEVNAEAGAAGVYAGYYLYEDESGLVSANVSLWDGANWTRLSDSAFFPLGTSSYATTEFGLRVFDEDGGDGLLLSVGGRDDAVHVFAYRDGAWEELPATDFHGGPSGRTSVAATGVPGEVALASLDCCTGMDGLSVKRTAGGSWNYVGEANFTDTAYEFYDDALAADGETLAVVYQTSVNWNGEETRGTLSVMHFMP